MPASSTFPERTFREGWESLQRRVNAAEEENRQLKATLTDIVTAWNLITTGRTAEANKIVPQTADSVAGSFAAHARRALGR